MKSIKFSSRIYKELRSKSKETENLEEGIIKALRDKYKPRVLYNIENLNEKNAQRRLA